MNILYVIIGGILAWHLISEFLWKRERTKLLNRIMAKDYTEFEFYDKQYKSDLNEVNKLRKTVRKTSKIPEQESVIDKEGKQFIGQLEEDWAEEEIDNTKLRKIVESENEFTNDSNEDQVR